jgi:hypothetical protein
MPRQANLFRKPTPEDFYCTLDIPETTSRGKPSKRTGPTPKELNILRNSAGINNAYPMYRLPPKDLEDYLGHTLEEISLALRLDAITVRGRHDGKTFVKSSKPVALFNKARQHAREASRYLVYLRLYRRDLIEALSQNTVDRVYLCETEYDLSKLYPDISHLENFSSRIESHYLLEFEDFTNDAELFAKFEKHQSDIVNSRREVQGKPSLPDMAVYTSLYDVLGFGHYNRPLGVGTTRYEAAKAIFPDTLAHLGIGKPLTAKEFTEGVQSMYSDLHALPKAFRALERFMEGIHRRYGLPIMTSYRSGMWFPTDSRQDEVTFAGQGFYKNSLNSPRLFHRGLLYAITHGEGRALREIMLKEGNHVTLLAILREHGILDEIMQVGFDLVINKILSKGIE